MHETFLPPENFLILLLTTGNYFVLVQVLPTGYIRFSIVPVSTMKTSN